MRQKKTATISSGTFRRRLGTMLRADMRRMLTTSRFYILLGCAAVMPVLILVMTTMAGGAAGSPAAGTAQTAMVFTDAWQIIGRESGAGMMAMDMTAMCNINLMYFLTGLFVCLFVADEFSGGYAKNLFAVRAKKGDYVASKTLVGFAAGTMFLLAFLAGAILGGSLAGLPFALGGAGIAGLVMCMLAKIFLMAVFSAIFLLMSTFGRHRAWLSVSLALFGGMLLFMMVPMLTPLDAGPLHVLLCLAGGIIFAAGIGRLSRRILMTVPLTA